MNIKDLLKRYRVFILILLLNIFMGVIQPKIGQSSLRLTSKNLIEMLTILPPIFILLGLMDVWANKEMMMKFLGEGSGCKGILLSFALGSFAAGPLYAAFPIASIMLQKGAKPFNVFVFIGAWSTMKIPLLTFEMVNLGIRFTLVRFGLNIIGILLIAWITNCLGNIEWECRK